MGRPPGVEQQHPLARLLEPPRGPGAEHAGADHDRRPSRSGAGCAAMRRRGSDGGHGRARPGEEQGAAADDWSRRAAPAQLPKRFLSVTPKVRGWLTA